MMDVNSLEKEMKELQLVLLEKEKEAFEGEAKIS